MKVFRTIGVRFALGAVLAISTVPLFFLLTPIASSASAQTPTCSTSQIRVALESDSGAYSAAGSHGFAFALFNVSHAVCALVGYPKIGFYPMSYKGASIKVTDNGAGQIFSTVLPRRVIIAPGSTASFGLNYGDAYNQGDPNGSVCMTQSVTVYLPVKPHAYSTPFTLPLGVNFCFAGFHFGVTSIQQAPLPRTG